MATRPTKPQQPTRRRQLGDNNEHGQNNVGHSTTTALRYSLSILLPHNSEPWQPHNSEPWQPRLLPRLLVGQPAALVHSLSMSMLGFVYLVLILGWILIVLFLKCKKSLAAPFRFGENYTDAIAETGERPPAVHVIQLQSEDIEQEEQYMDNFHRQSENLQRYSHRSTLEERTIERTYPTDAVINPAFMHDEEYIINAPPPTYEEVMRQPQVYPQVRHNNHKLSDANI